MNQDYTFVILGRLLVVEFHLNLVNTRGIVFRVVLDDVYVTGTVFIVQLHLARDLKNIPDLVQVFLEPPAAFTSHVSHGVIVFLGDQRATSRHSWNISVVSPIKYSPF